MLYKHNLILIQWYPLIIAPKGEGRGRFEKPSKKPSLSLSLSLSLQILYKYSTKIFVTMFVWNLSPLEQIDRFEKFYWIFEKKFADSFAVNFEM